MGAAADVDAIEAVWVVVMVDMASGILRGRGERSVAQPDIGVSRLICGHAAGCYYTGEKERKVASAMGVGYSGLIRM